MHLLVVSSCTSPAGVFPDLSPSIQTHWVAEIPDHAWLSCTALGALRTAGCAEGGGRRRGRAGARARRDRGRPRLAHHRPQEAPAPHGRHAGCVTAHSAPAACSLPEVVACTHDAHRLFPALHDAAAGPWRLLIGCECLGLWPCADEPMGQTATPRKLEASYTRGDLDEPPSSAAKRRRRQNQ